MCRGGTYCACPDGSKPNADGTCKQSNGCGPHMVQAKDPVTGAPESECVCEPGYHGTSVNGSYTCIPPSQCDQSPESCCPTGTGTHWNRQTGACVPTAQLCNPSDPATWVYGGIVAARRANIDKLTKRCDPDNKNPK